MVNASETTTAVVGVIYGIRLVDSDPYRYVGLTTKSAEGRFREHSKQAAAGKKTPFYDWLRKVTVQAAIVDVLEEVRTTMADLGAAEIRWIAEFRALGVPLLNLTDGGLGPQGYVWTDEQRAAAAVRATGRPGPWFGKFGPESASFGLRHSEEQKTAWSAMRTGSITGEKNPNFGKFGADHPSFGRVVSEELRSRLSAQKVGEKNPNFGKSPSAETRSKQSAALKGRPRPSSARSAHTRYHTNKGEVSAFCVHCDDDANLSASQLAAKAPDNA